MRYIVLKVLVLLLAAGFVAVALADRPNDVYVQIDNDLLEAAAKDAKVGKTGRELYRTQESTNRTVQRSTGLDVDNYYVWFCVGNECVPLDPYTFSN
jgi:hypothetical protein